MVDEFFQRLIIDASAACDVGIAGCGDRLAGDVVHMAIEIKYQVVDLVKQIMHAVEVQGPKEALYVAERYQHGPRVLEDVEALDVQQ